MTAQNPATLLRRAPAARLGGSVRYLPGWTVQCINPECQARGQWLRPDNAPEDHCSNCGDPLQTVPPPLASRLRLRPRPLTLHRPRQAR